MSNERISLQEIVGLLERDTDRYPNLSSYPVLKFTNGKEMWTLTVRTPAGNTLEIKGYMKRARDLLLTEGTR